MKTVEPVIKTTC